MQKISRRHVLRQAGLIGAATIVMPSVLRAQQKTLTIGQIGVMSGPAASWGSVNRYCALATAEMKNEAGGVKIGPDTYRIEIASVDDRNDARLAASGAERLISSQGVRYIIGPNTDITATSIRPVAEGGAALYIPYAFAKPLYTAPASNAVLGMIASYQVAPVMYKILKERGAKRFVFVARNDPDGLLQREEGVKAAKALGIEVVAAQDTYEANVTDFFSIMANSASAAPDVIVLSGAAPSHTPQMMRAARELGFKGLFASESAQDIKVINEVAGNFGDGLISLGGASTPEIRSAYMDEFIKRYTKVAGEWNDEAGTKAYALEMILGTLQAVGPQAIGNIEPFKAAMPNFSMKNPFLKQDTQIRYTGESSFGQKRQIGVPVVITETKGGKLVTVAVESLG